MVLFDANFLLLLLDPDISVPKDPQTGAPLERAKERVEHLIATLAAAHETIGIPTPVMAEVLVYAGVAGPSYVGIITQNRNFRVLPFDLRAAIECAAMTNDALLTGKKKSGSAAPWQKVKIDRQIIAIGIVERISKIYGDDGDLLPLARDAGIEVESSWQLSLPPENPQQSLPL
ncbi:hypothetical protein ACFSM5_20200 [Lacibacterium aquatile]|uniref:PIN domain-containing protein n=1 Tax=Lacibacterium aquatile TaxID=1168082 RepID=A0ABW5E0Q5_9PROT